MLEVVEIVFIAEDARVYSVVPIAHELSGGLSCPCGPPKLEPLGLSMIKLG
jgi:hypothetical protein